MSEQEISGKWKKIFALIDKAGGVDDKTWEELPLAKNLSTGERMAIGFNVWGFIFGVFYYLYLRMWKKGIFLFGIIFLVMVFLELFESVYFPDNKLLKKLAAASYFAMPAFFAARANIDYYKKIFAHGKADENKFGYIGIASIIAAIAITSFVYFKGIGNDHLEARIPAAAPGAAKDSPLTKENLYSFIEKHKSKDFAYIQEAKDFISRDVVLPIVGNQMTKDGNFTFLRTDSAMSYPEGISYVLITCAKASGITSLAVDEKATVKFSSFAVAGVKDNEFRIVPNTPCELDKQVVSSTPAAEQSIPVPPLKARVTDLTATLTVTQIATLEKEVARLESRSGAQLAILMVPTTQSESIDQYANRVFASWKLGRSAFNDGVLIVLAQNDHRVRISVGLGLESSLDSQRIIDEMVTYFKAGNFFGGLEAALVAINAKLSPLVPGPD